MLRISKRVPARTKTLTLKSCVPFQVMSERFRAIRGGSRNPMDKCYWCNRPFENGDQMHIGFQVKGRNIVLCDMCADNLEGEPELKRS